MKRKFWITIEGIEPIFHYYIRYNNGNSKKTSVALFFPFRRIKKKFDDKKIYKNIISYGFKPIQCEGCADGWAEYSIEDPNEPKGTNKRIKVCRDCVGFYDWKWTNQRLYKDVEDFRG